MLIPIYMNTKLLKTFRGCVTSGKRWVFFVYNVENPEHGRGKAVHWLEAIPLGAREHHNPTVNLELILGILRDWVSLNLVTQPIFDVQRLIVNKTSRLSTTRIDLFAINF